MFLLIDSKKDFFKQFFSVTQIFTLLTARFLLFLWGGFEYSNTSMYKLSSLSIIL